MFTTAELRIIFRLARERISKLERTYWDKVLTELDPNEAKARIFELETVIWQVAWQKMCADCRGPAETTWKDGTPLCYGCAYGRAGWEA